MQRFDFVNPCTSVHKIDKLAIKFMNQTNHNRPALFIEIDKQKKHCPIPWACVRVCVCVLFRNLDRKLYGGSSEIGCVSKFYLFSIAETNSPDSWLMHTLFQFINHSLAAFFALSISPSVEERTTMKVNIILKISSFRLCTKITRYSIYYKYNNKRTYKFNLPRSSSSLPLRSAAAVVAAAMTKPIFLLSILISGTNTRQKFKFWPRYNTSRMHEKTTTTNQWARNDKDPPRKSAK